MSGEHRHDLLSSVDPDWLRAPDVATIFDILDGAEGRTRIVGGAIRNALLGQPVGDIDFATELDVAEVTARAGKAGLRVIPTGIDHGTVTIVVEGRPFEITTLRQDLETDGRRATVGFTDDWKADAARRDFTVNAVYLNADGTLFDPLEQGLADIAARRIRFIGNPVARIREDFLRILRFFRFHAWYGRGDPDADGLAAVAAERAGLDQLSRERVGHEMLRLLAAPDPTAALGAMTECGVMAHVLTEPPRLDAFARLIAVERTTGRSPDAVLRLAVLARDEPLLIGERLRLSRAQTARIAAASDSFMPETEKGARARLAERGTETYVDQSLFAWALSDRSTGDAALAAFAALPERWIPPAFPVSGRDAHAVGVPDGPQTGQALDAARKAWIDSDFSADRTDLMRVMADFAKGD